MILNELILSAISANNELTDIVGENVYFEVLPQDVSFPCVVFKVESDNTEQFVDGSRSRLINQVIQFVFYSKSVEIIGSILDLLDESMRSSDDFESHFITASSNGFFDELSAYSYFCNYSVWATL